MESACFLQLVQTLGTVLCPCLEDTQMLDPLTCKKVSQSRLTSIAFKEDSILLTCQEGYMQAWQRPNAVSCDIFILELLCWFRVGDRKVAELWFDSRAGNVSILPCK